MADNTATPRTLGGGMVRATGIVIAMIGSFQQVANVTTVMWNNVSSEVVRASQ